LYFGPNDTWLLFECQYIQHTQKINFDELSKLAQMFFLATVLKNCNIGRINYKVLKCQIKISFKQTRKEHKI